MEAQATVAQTSPDQLTDMLLVIDKEKKSVKAVTDIDKEGSLTTVAPTKINENRFLRIDKQGNLLSNFFSNFLSQAKNPTRFTFLRLPVDQLADIVKKIKNYLTHPSKEGEAFISQYEVSAGKEQNQKNETNMETTQTTPATGEYRYQPEQINWEVMSNMGLSREYLERKKLLEPLLKGYKTNELVPVRTRFAGAVIRTDARLSLQTNETGQVVIAVHGIRKEPELQFPFFSHNFSQKDKDNLLQTGNMGRIVDLVNPKTKETIPSIVSVDRLTNELVALPADKIKIPEVIKGVTLDEQQKKTLQEGKPLYLEGMISNKNEPFNATLQYSADKRHVEFLFNNGIADKIQQTQQNGKEQAFEVPQEFRGKKLSEEQRQKLGEGQTVYMDGLKDKEGKSYQGYITFSKETGKTGFQFPSQAKANAQPVEANKTQVEVNSNGKTNEATSNIKEPLKSGQKNPDSKEQKDQQKVTPPKKSRGIKR